MTLAAVSPGSWSWVQGHWFSSNFSSYSCGLWLLSMSHTFILNDCSSACAELQVAALYHYHQPAERGLCGPLQSEKPCPTNGPREQWELTELWMKAVRKTTTGNSIWQNTGSGGLSSLTPHLLTSSPLTPRSSQAWHVLREAGSQGSRCRAAKLNCLENVLEKRNISSFISL